MLFIIKNFHFLIGRDSLKALFVKINFIRKYNFKSKLNFNIFKLLKHLLISEILLVKNINSIKQLKKKYNLKYTFSVDWFSYNIPTWNFFINKEININKKNLAYLEIGSYEGRSVIHICENYKNFNVTVVDPYLKYREIEGFSNQDIKKTYKIFKENIKNFKNRIKFYRIKSNDFFKQNKQTYDLVYIDGSHFYKDVVKDFKNALNILNINGLIILDDFTWNYYKKIEHNPIAGILPLIKNNTFIKIISVSNQIIVKKTGTMHA